MADKKTLDKGEEFELVEKPEDADEDTRIKTDDGDDDAGDVRLHVDADEDAEARRQRNRDKKRSDKDRRKTAEQRDKAEIERLRRELAGLAQGQQQLMGHAARQNAAGLDHQLNAYTAEYQRAEAEFAEAARLGDGQAQIIAMRKREIAAQRWNEVNSAKAQTAQQAAQRAQAPAAPDPVVKRNIDRFMRDHDWYDPQGNDDDSAVLTAIDQKIASEGFDPATQDYWDELKERAVRVLPDKFGKRRGGPPRASGRGDAPTGKTQVYLSPERVKAIKDAGKWDDPKERASMIDRYVKYDRSNPSA